MLYTTYTVRFLRILATDLQAFKDFFFLVWDMSLRVPATDLQYVMTFFSSELDMASVSYR
jgi:hypothetical protein